MNRFVSWWCKLFLAPLIKRLFVQEVIGLENIPKRNFIFTSNHLSYLDIIMNGYVLVPKKFNFIGQIDGFRGLARFFVRLLYWVCGVIVLDRKSEKSRKEAVEKAIKILEKGNILVIYPEGRRSLTGEIQEGQLGVAKIFLKTGVPIIPSAVKGTFELMPPKGRLKIKKSVKINIGKPLYFGYEFEKAKRLDCGSKEYKEVSQKIIDTTLNETKKLLEEL